MIGNKKENHIRKCKRKLKKKTYLKMHDDRIKLMFPMKKQILYTKMREIKNICKNQRRKLVKKKKRNIPKDKRIRKAERRNIMWELKKNYVKE